MAQKVLDALKSTHASAVERTASAHGDEIAWIKRDQLVTVQADSVSPWRSKNVCDRMNGRSSAERRGLPEHPLSNLKRSRHPDLEV